MTSANNSSLAILVLSAYLVFFSASACQKVSPGNITKQLEVPLPLWRSSRVELKQGIIFFLGIGWRSIELETCITTLLPVFKSGLRAGLKEHL